MILDWAEAEKLSHIGTIEVTNTYPNMIGDQSCFLCSFKDHQYWQWTYPKIVRYFPEREEMTSMKMLFSNQKSNCWQKQKQKPKQKKPHWILKPKVWDSSKQDTFRDGREGVSVFWGNTIYSLLHDWIMIHLRKAFSSQFK